MGRVKRTYHTEGFEVLRAENEELKSEIERLKSIEGDIERLEAQNYVLSEKNDTLEEKIESKWEFDLLVNDLFDWVEYHKPRMNKELRNRFEKAGYVRQLARGID